MFFANRIRAQKFKGREDLSFDEIYARTFEPSGVPKDVAGELWFEAAKTLHIPATKLRPSDRFDSELRYHLAWLPFVDLNDEFYWAGVARLKRLQADNTVFENAKTLGEYIVAFGRLEAKARPPGT
jgi:hypothetical protein